MKRYFLAETATSKYIGITTIEEIAALLNANKIQEDYVAAERTSTIPSYVQLMKSGDAKWVTVAQLLAAAYKNEPLITVVLKDVGSNTILLSERYYSDDGPWEVALGAVEDYFDQHFKEFAKTSSKDFLIYFKSDKCPPSVMTVKVKFESRTFKKGVTGSREDPYEETYPYTYEEGECRKVEPPDEFPSVALELKPPKYDPTATLPPGWD